jgi:uncharacterized coiled-coil DUF342 family protein
MDHLYKEIVNFQHRVNDYIDDTSLHSAQSLLQTVQRLEDDVQVRKSAQSVEGSVKTVVRALEEAGEKGAMSHDHVDELVDHCEEFLQELRKLR